MRVNSTYLREAEWIAALRELHCDDEKLRVRNVWAIDRVDFEDSELCRVDFA
jgi:hypothetical protein